MAEIRLRRGTTSEWMASDPILAPGEPGLNTTTRRLKFGDGVSKWSQLAYPDTAPPGTPISIQDHVESEDPHPVYDDGTSFLLRYENAKV